MLSLEIRDTGNSAFEDDFDAEVARILRKAARLIEAGEDCGSLFDSNGNKVGEFSLARPDEEVQFVVTFYEQGDDGMDNPLEFRCQAANEDDAAEACLQAHPGCTTTFVEEEVNPW